MKQFRSLLLPALLLVTTGLLAQGPGPKMKIVSTMDEATVVNRSTSSSSRSCHSGDFPAYQDAMLTDVKFSDLRKIIVHHEPSSVQDTNHIRVELVTKNGESRFYEMIKHIRFAGDSETGDYSLKVKDIKTVEILE